MRATLMMVLVVVGLAGTAAADAVLTGHVTDLVGKPVAGARVHVLSGGSEQQVTTTDADGNYRVVVDGNQEVSVVIGAGTLHTFRRGAIKDGTIRKLDLEVEIAEGEIIRIIDDKPPAVPPKLPGGKPRVTPPYSDEAVARDAWAKAWLLLDVSETGKVLRVKLVKRPGFDLNEIAVKEAMKLVFEPARDEHGKPVRARILWSMEWPSHGWLIEHNGTANKLPPESFAINPLGSDFGNAVTIDSTPHLNRAINGEKNQPTAELPGLSGDDTPTFNGPRVTLGHVPESAGIPLTPSPFTEVRSLAGVRCAGTGPLNLDERYPVYRDCSKPNLKKLPHLPWLDGTQPIPPEPEQFAAKPEPPLHLTKASYIPQIISSTVSAGLLAFTVYSGLRMNHYEGVLANSAVFGTTKSLDQVARDEAKMIRYRKLSIIGGIATIASGVFTTGLWFRHQRKADFSVQPEDDGGASVSVSGRF